MDLPTCRACGQSVIDDDVTECPFCGAPMHGKAAAGVAKSPRSPSPAQAKPSPSTTGSTSARAKPKPSSAEAVSDEDLFAEEAKKSAVRALPVSRKPKRGWTYRVVCPMCETAGFIPRKAAGKHVRCANPECLVPIFQAPVPDSAAVEPEEVAESSWMSVPVLSAVSAVLIAAIGWGVWQFVIRPAQQGTDTQADGRNSTIAQTGLEDLEKRLSSPVEPKEGKPEPRPLTIDEIRDEALKQMIASSRLSLRDGNRSKPFCRRLTAEAFALVGDVDAVRTQLRQLDAVRGDTVPFYRVWPHVALAWKARERKQQPLLSESVEEAWKAMQTFPRVTRDSLDAAVRLAALLVAVGRIDDAQALLRRHVDRGPNGQFNMLWHMAHVVWQDDFDQAAENRAVLDVPHPQWATVSALLASRHLDDAALEWCRSAPDDLTRSDALASLVEVLLSSGSLKRAAPAEIVARLNAMTPAPTDAAIRARLLALAARHRLTAGDQKAADELLAAAEENLASIQLPEAVPLDTVEAVIAYRLPDGTLWKLAATAAGEIAFVHHARGNADSAATALNRAVEYVHRVAPDPRVVAERLAELETRRDEVRRSLQRLRNLDSDLAIDRAFAQYRQICRRLEAAAAERLAAETALLDRALERGLIDAVHDRIAVRGDDGKAVIDDTFLRNGVATHLAARYRLHKQMDRAAEIEAQLPRPPALPGLRIVIGLQLGPLLESDDLVNAARLIETAASEDRLLRTWWALRVSCRLVRADRFRDALRFAAQFEDILVREECLRMICGQAARRGQAAEVWARVKEARIKPTERVAACLSLIEAISDASEDLAAGIDGPAAESGSVGSLANRDAHPGIRR